MIKQSILILLVLSNYFVFGQKVVPLNFGVKISINSKYLKDKNDIWIKLPEDFRKHRDSCSILILLDGDEYFGAAVNTQKFYQIDNKMPATIIVAIPSTTESRWRDYTPTHSKNFTGNEEYNDLFELTGNFSRFANFVEKEVIRLVEKRYRVTLINKTIFGHSLGGLAVMSFYRLRPAIFNNYICASPSLLWNNFMFNKFYEKDYPKNSINKRKIFFSSGNPDMREYKNAVENLYKSLKAKTVDPDKYLKYIHYETEDHAASGIRSLIDGLEFVYSKSK